MRTTPWLLLLALLPPGCDEGAGPGGAGAGGSGGAAGSTPSTPGLYEGSPTLRVAVPEGGGARVRLDPLSLVDPGDDTWDLAFVGLDVRTNSGPSGTGQGSAFGPLGPEDFAAGAPAVPFTVADRTGGAFLGWYAYEGAPSHALWSRYHVVAVQDGERAWKVQILSYYGERDGAPHPALYRLRYAELTDVGAGPAREIELDGTAGGGAAASAPSGCVDLATGAQVFHTIDEARASTDWHLCVRRDAVGVNGELGGPRGVVAADLDAGLDEPLAEVKKRSADSERARFDAVTRASLAGVRLRGDRVRSAFDGAWLDADKRPVPATWLVVGADGARRFLVAFSATEGPGPVTPGTVVMHARTIP